MVVGAYLYTQILQVPKLAWESQITTFESSQMEWNDNFGKLTYKLVRVGNMRQNGLKQFADGT